MKKKILLLLYSSLIFFTSYSQSTVGSVVNLPNSNCVLDVNSWNYIAFTKGNNNEGKVYKNGQLIYSGTWSNITYSWSRLDLGAVFFTSYNGWFNGQIDELRISSIVRTSNEISTHFNSNSPFAIDSNTIGLWHFDEANTATLSAATGVNGNGFNVTSAPGKFGNSFSFNGSSSRAQINQTVPTTNLTIEFWIKPQGINNDVWPVNMYGFNTSGFAISQVNLNCLIPTGSLSNGLIGYWPFCGNANDESGNGYNGVVNGPTLTSDRFGNSNSAYNYINLNDNITLSNSQNIVNGSFSVSAWCTIENLSPSYFDATLIGQFNGQIANERKWLFGYRSAGNQRGISYYLFDNFGNGQSNFATLNWNPIQSNWYHIVWVFNSGNSIQTYINGVLHSDVPTSLLTLNNSSNNLTKIGNAIDIDIVQNLPWRGKIDDIAIWNRVLTQQEITNLYNNNLSAEEFAFSKANISIYPNPTNSDFYIHSDDEVSLIGSLIRVTNVLGQQVYANTITGNQQYVSIQGNPKGLYIVSIYSQGGELISSKKLLYQ